MKISGDKEEEKKNGSATGMIFTDKDSDKSVKIDLSQYEEPRDKEG